jgi:hypothetical protein
MQESTPTDNNIEQTRDNVPTTINDNKQTRNTQQKTIYYTSNGNMNMIGSIEELCKYYTDNKTRTDGIKHSS